ncbi:LysR family transcriptional regulator [Neptunomonas antarctica]|uniref:DNA-binding transcriptional regulator, LysR family n=1 Tax=Neptunomonas antarctica TaxID=619304 RepID=A0A1N7JY47_9GAMM|nr:LysR family transcriptional regulator [Neptunomonas antarctica]SIS54166.1 DNA-binding transcriptional regulator, LysR family [Neptunomonas antarctica]
MNLNDISLFIRIVETGSFTSAAESLGIQKSTISRRIAQLEDDLGVRLLQRTTRKLKLTDDGEELFARCQPLINELDSAKDHLSATQNNPRGRLRITMPSELGVFMMNEIVSTFMQRYPQIMLEVELSTRVIDLIEEGIDLAIRVGELADSSLIARKVATVSRGLYASPAYLTKQGTPKTPDDLQNHECYGILKAVEYWEFDNWHEPVEVKGQLKANSISFIREVLLQNMGVARMPRVFCRNCVNRGELVEVLSDYASPPIEVHALYPSRRHLNPKVRLFIDHMMEMIGDHPWVNEQMVTPVSTHNHS